LSGSESLSFNLVIVLSVLLWFTAYDYPSGSGIFKLFLLKIHDWVSHLFSFLYCIFCFVEYLVPNVARVSGLSILDSTFVDIMWIKGNKKYHTIGTFPKPNSKIVERSKIDITNTQMDDLSLSWFGTGTSLLSGRVKLVLWLQASPLSIRFKILLIS